MVPLIVSAGVGPLLAWKRGDLPGALARLAMAAGVTVVVALITAIVAGVDLHNVAAAGGLGLAAWLAGAAITEWTARVRPFSGGAFSRAVRLPRAAHGMTLAHFGMAVVIAGVTASSAWKQEHIQTMSPGQTIATAGYTVRFDGAEPVQGPNYSAARGNFTVLKDGRVIASLASERRTYIQPQQTTTVPAVHSMPLADIYAVIGEPQGATGAFVTRVYFQPLVPWIWAGVILMGLGGVASLSDRRLRVGAPRRVPAAAAQPAE
jgi:cytochrome c-type biogenesis protein CcmF